MDKMREEFEAWAVNVYGTARMGFAVGFYSRDEVQWAWQAWQASRKALVVELPEHDNFAVWISRDMVDGYKSAIDDVRDALEAAGVAYK